MTIVWLIVFVTSLYVLSKAADYFTDAAEKIGTRLRMSSFVVGVLIVAVGTSIPELATSVAGVLKGEVGVLSGNVIGSTIANIFLGLGLVVVISRRVAKFHWDSVSNDMPFLLGAAILLALTIIDKVFNFYEAIVFLIAYVVYVIYSLKIRKMSAKEIQADLHQEISTKLKEDLSKTDGKPHKTKKEKKQDTIKTVLILVVSLIAIIISARYAIDSLISLAVIFGVGTSVLAASLVAIGTSLPEISVALAAAKKGNFDMVIGNVMGSNIFNILIVFGTVGLFTNITIPQIVLVLALPMMGAAILIQWLVTMDRKITITEGCFMTILYIVFIVKLFGIF